jgi:hypothetical protein
MTMIKMTHEQAYEKAKSLTIEKGKEVRAIILQISDDDLCVGFVQKPSRGAKIESIGAVTRIHASGNGVNPVDMGMPLLESGFLPDVSDPRMNPIGGDDDIVISAAMHCADMIKMYADTLKKK